MFRRTPTSPELSGIPLFEGLSAKELALVTRLSTPVTVAPGHVLAHEGDRGAEFFVVVDGEVDVLREGEVIATRGAGCHLGEIALLGGRPRTATLVTATPVKALVASRQEFSGMVAEVPTIADRLQASMVERLAA